MLDYKNKECEIFREAQAKREVLSADDGNIIYLDKAISPVFEKHCSTRVFNTEEIMSFKEFSSILSILISRSSRGYTRYYPSAGGLFPIDIYMYVKKRQGGGYWRRYLLLFTRKEWSYKKTNR